MNASHRARWWQVGLLLVWLGGVLPLVQPALAQNQEKPADKSDPQKAEELPPPRQDGVKKDEKKDEAILARLPQRASSILPGSDAFNAIDLACVLRLAGVNNPDMLLARQRVAQAAALRFLAWTFVLPNFNTGLNYDDHNGPLQQSSGNILTVNRQALYLGMGAGAIAAGTVAIPGVWYNLNFADDIFNALAMRYNLRARAADNIAVRNQMLLRVATAYMKLARAEAFRSIAIRNQEEAREIAYLTAAHARRGTGREGDADRAASELAFRNEVILQAEQEMLVASANLAALLNIPPSVQLHAVDGWIVPTEIVPNVLPLQELIFIATQQRPELAARRNDILAAVQQLRRQIFLPLSPTVLAGYSAGTFGGGSNLVAYPGGFQGFQQSYFGNFAPRQDVDVIMFWTAQNLGVGNLGRIRVARAERNIAQLEFLRELNRVRDEVAVAYAKIHANYAQIDIARQGMETAWRSFTEDYKRIRDTIRDALPIELLNSFHLLADARLQYLDAVVNYDIGQFALYVALGQPPPALFAHEVPSNVLTKDPFVPENPSYDLMPTRPAPAKPLPACVPAGGGSAACVTGKTHP
jgi:outer membrane protein TolC